MTKYEYGMSCDRVLRVTATGCNGFKLWADTDTNRIVSENVYTIISVSAHNLN